MDADPVLTLMHQPLTAQPRRLDARRGASLVLGSCDCEECTPDLVLPARPGAWLCCVIRAQEDHWRLDNLCMDIEVAVVDLENPDLRVSAPPGRRQLVVPFEFSGLSFRIGRRRDPDAILTVCRQLIGERLRARCCSGSSCSLRSAHLRRPAARSTGG